MRDRGIDRVLRDVSQRAEIIRRGMLRRARRATGASVPNCVFILCAVCQVRVITSPTRPIAWLSLDIIENAPRSCSRSSAAIVSGANARLRKGHVLRDLGIEVMTHHEHVEMLIDRVHREGTRGIGGGGQHIGLATHPDDIRRMATSGALGMIGMDRASLERPQSVLHESRFVQRVGMNGHLHVQFVGDPEAAIDRGRSRSPVLVKLQSDRAREDLLPQRLGR